MPDLKYFAMKGYLGHDAALDPEGFVSKWGQAARELPGDVADALSPSGIANTTKMIGQAVSSGFAGATQPLGPPPRAPWNPEPIKTENPSWFIPSSQGPTVAQNATNEFGLSDRLKTKITPEPQPVQEEKASPNIRSIARASRNYEMLNKGKSMKDIMDDEKKNPLK